MHEKNSQFILLKIPPNLPSLLGKIHALSIEVLIRINYGGCIDVAVGLSSCAMLKLQFFTCLPEIDQSEGKGTLFFRAWKRYFGRKAYINGIPPGWLGGTMIVKRAMSNSTRKIKIKRNALWTLENNEIHTCRHTPSDILKYINEPKHDKTNKMTRAPSEDSDLILDVRTV